MPRVDGEFVAPFPPVVPDTTIESAVHNGIVADFVADANAPRPITAGGTGAISAAAARTNLQTERAMQTVTNYDSHVWENGSFWSAAGATGAPEAAGTYGGICYIINNDPNYILVEARHITNGTLYVRRKNTTWGAWVIEGAADYVNVTGDTMTGGLIIGYANPSLALNRTAANNNASISSYFNNVARWHVMLGDGATESGGNVGSNFAIYRANDDGSFGGAALTIDRSNGNFIFAGNTTSAGDITINKIIPALILNKTASGQNNIIAGQTGGVNRWTILNGDTVNEAGSNNGSDFQIIRHDDFGTNIDVPLHIKRSTGDVTLTHSLTLSGLLTASGPVSIGGALTSFNTISATTNLIIQQAGGGGNAHLVFKNNAATNVWANYWDAANDSLLWSSYTGKGMTLSSGGALTCSYGIICKPGTAGIPGASAFNIEWTGTPQLWVDATNVGTFAFTSDYRIKDNVAPLPSMWDTVKALSPISYTHKNFTPPSALEMAEKSGEPFIAGDAIERWGFIAHELQETLTESAATGVKDAPDTIQSPNPFTIIAALTKALQEAMARIEALEGAGAARNR